MKEDMKKFSEALASDNVRQMALFLTSAELAIDEVRALTEERYTDEIETAQAQADEALGLEAEEEEETEEEEEEEEGKEFDA